jgi:hypothetical protein
MERTAVELPFHLRALPPEALDVLRFFGTLNDPLAYSDEIMEGVRLSERMFGKVIRRLVTKGYLAMDGDQAYRLSDEGQESVLVLREYDAAAPVSSGPAKRGPNKKVARRMVIVMPRTLRASQSAEVTIGFHPAAAGQSLGQSAEVVVRVSLINAQPQRPQDVVFHLSDSAGQQTITIIPDAINKLRLKAQAFQLGPNPDDIQVAGGMYVDVPVLPAGTPPDEDAAYGTPVTLAEL